ncbi:MAG: NifU family protein [Anaerolineaceae bacterium]|nr:NifU family protein [Anaerolineaceae bacterium]
MKKQDPAEHDFSKEEKIAGLIDQVSAYIEHYHHGSVELVNIEGQTIKVRLGGACENCPLSTATLQGWVAGTIRQFFPDMELIAVE